MYKVLKIHATVYAAASKTSSQSVNVREFLTSEQLHEYDSLNDNDQTEILCSVGDSLGIYVYDAV